MSVKGEDSKLDSPERVRLLFGVSMTDYIADMGEE